MKMIKVLKILLLLALISNCKGQVQPTKENINTSPRVDSTLQFTLMITSMFQDSKGHFWFGTHGDGICRYDGKQYTYFTVGQGLPGGIDREFAPGPDWSITRNINGGNQINSIQEDKAGNVFYKNGENQVCKFNGETFDVIEPEKESTLSVTKSEEEWKADLNCLWFENWEKPVVYRYDGAKLSFLKFPPAHYWKQGGVSEIYKDKKGNLWFGTMGGGTYRYDGKSFTPIFGADEIGISRSIFEDNSGRIWMTNNGVGLYYLEEGKLVNFTTEYSLQNPNDPLADEFNSGFQAIEQDKNGDLWFGTFSSGLWRYDGKKLKYYTKSGLLPIVTVKTIYKDKSGKLWFGIGEGSVYGFDGKTFYRFDEEKGK